MLGIIIVYITLLMGAGIYDMFRAKTFEDFATAGKRQTFMPVFMSLTATIIGASATLGVADKITEIGFCGFLWLGTGATGLAGQALFLSEKIRGFNANTLPEIADITVGHGAKILLALVIATAWVGVIAAQLVSMTQIISMMLPQFDRSAVLFVISTVVVLYTLFGGQLSVVRTDILQAFVIIVGFTITFVYILINGGRGFGEITLLNNGFTGRDLLSLVFLTGGAYFLGPDIISRNLISNNGKTAKKAVFAAAAVLLLYSGIITLTSMWCVHNIPDLNGVNPLLYIMNNCVPYPLAVILCLPLVSALLSSADTCIINAASIIEQDILHRNKISETRIAVCILGISALAIAVFNTDIIGLLISAYSVYVPAIVCPLSVAIWFYKKRVISKPLWYPAVVSGGVLGTVGTISGNDILPIIGMGVSLMLSILSVTKDKVSTKGIKKFLDDKNIEIEVIPETTSTNTLIRERSDKGEGYAIIANSQTNGRGRQGHSFYSPKDTGIYMSVLLHPNDTDTDKITTIAAVAACDAISRVTGLDTQIKWVNDIYINGKKVAGILTEAVFKPDNSLDCVILGIGINAYVPKCGFPDEIRDIAGAVYEIQTKNGKNILAAEFINRFMYYYKNSTDYVKLYRRRCFVIGKEISVISPDGTRDAVASDIDDKCRLIVQYPDGSTAKLSSGEISIKPKMYV